MASPSLYLQGEPAAGGVSVGPAPCRRSFAAPCSEESEWERKREFSRRGKGGTTKELQGKLLFLPRLHYSIYWGRKCISRRGRKHRPRPRPPPPPPPRRRRRRRRQAKQSQATPASRRRRRSTVFQGRKSNEEEEKFLKVKRRRLSVGRRSVGLSFVRLISTRRQNEEESRFNGSRF